MSGFLKHITAVAGEQVGERQKIKPLSRLQADWAALTDSGTSNTLGITARERFIVCLSKPGLSLIAEIKRASPSRGGLAPGLLALEQARLYAQAGAQAISVLTEKSYFQGRINDLNAISGAVDLPVLQKDFIVDPYQIWEGALAGAHAVLLIARVLGPQLPHYIAVCRELGLASLVETHTEKEIELALASGAQIIGVNCRDLNTLTLDPAKHAALRCLIPPGIRTVAESGIHRSGQVKALAALGYDAILVGESLVTAPDPAAKIRELLGGGQSDGLA